MEFLKVLGVWLFLVTFVECILRGTFYRVPVIGTVVATIAVICYILSFILFVVLGVGMQINS